MTHAGQGNKNDETQHPQHYNQGTIECLDYILDQVGWECYLIGNIIKYVTRYRYKNGVQDLKKAKFYLTELITRLEKL